MSNNLQAILSKNIRYRSLGVLALLTVYAILIIFIFFQGVKPSLAEGTTNETFAVDSTIYMDIADSLRNGEVSPIQMRSLLSFPNTVVTPVAIYLILGNPLLVLCFNCVLFAISIALLNRSFSFSLGFFMFLLLLNPTTTTSLLCLNKEIIDLFVLSLFLYSLKHSNTLLRISALAIALVNRYEICVVLLVFIFAQSRLNPLRARRFLTLFALVLMLTLVMPFFASSMLSARFQEAQYGGAIAALDSLQMHYLYVVAVIPKIAENLFGQLLNSAVWKPGGGPQAENTSWLYIMFFNNLANFIVILIALKRRVLTTKHDLVYCSALGAVLVAQSLAIQPRYFYFAYILLCLQVAFSRVPSTQPLFSSLQMERASSHA